MLETDVLASEADSRDEAQALQRVSDSQVSGGIPMHELEYSLALWACGDHHAIFSIILVGNQIAESISITLSRTGRPIANRMLHCARNRPAPLHALPRFPDDG